MAEDELPTVVEGQARPVPPAAKPSGPSAVTTAITSTSATQGQSRTLGTPDTLGSLPSSTLELSKPETVLRRAAFEQTRRTAMTGLFFNLLGAIITRMPARPSRLAKLHPHVDLFFAIALAKSPSDRFKTADELTSALEAALAGKLRLPLRERAAALIEAWPWAASD